MLAWPIIAGLLAGLAGVFVFPPRYAHAAIGTPSNVGSASNETAGNSLQITGANVTAGNSIIVVFAMDPSTTTVSIADSAGNSYTNDADATRGSVTSGVRGLVWSAHNVAALSSGTITVTLGANVTAKAMQAIQVSGLHSSGRDQANTATGSATSGNRVATVTSGTTTRASELVIGGITQEGDAAITAGTGYTIIGSQPQSGSGGAAAGHVGFITEYKTVSATGTQTADGTLGGNYEWAAVVVTYKDGAAVPDLPTPLAAVLASLGAGGAYYMLRRRAFSPRA